MDCFVVPPRNDEMRQQKHTTMNEKIICGIQQVGIGVNDFVEAWKWYYDNFGFEIKIVDDEGVAERMLPYTGGKPHVAQESRSTFAAAAVSRFGNPKAARSTT